MNIQHQLTAVISDSIRGIIIRNVNMNSRSEAEL